jgi:hypothetical protein
VGFLSDTAKKGFRNSQRRVFVPEWMQLAQWAALAIIPIIVLIGFMKPDVAAGPSRSAGDTVNTGTNNGSTPPVNDTLIIADGKMIRLPKVGGGTVAVPSGAAEVAKAAGLATWTGDWGGVPVSGPTPDDAQFPNAALGDLTVFIAEADLVTFAVQLDAEGDGRFEQSFQISVVRDGGRWVYPTTAG